MAARTLRIGKVRLRRHHPTVIAPITDRTRFSELAAAVRQGLDLAEARVDLCRQPGAESVTPLLERARRLVPLLVTVRAASEGGAWKQSEAERLELYRALLPHAELATRIELHLEPVVGIVELLPRLRQRLFDRVWRLRPRRDGDHRDLLQTLKGLQRRANGGIEQRQLVDDGDAAD